MKQVIAGLTQLTWPIGVNMYLIEDPDGLTLIDASIPPAGKWVLNQLAKMGHQPADLKRILITHAHPDHYGALGVLKEATGAEVIASALEQRVLERQISVPRRPSGARPPDTWIDKPVKVDRVIDEGDRLYDVMGGMEVVSAPGHAPGQITLWHPDHRVLIAGDTMFNITGLALPWAAMTVDMVEAKRSVGKVAGLDPQILCLGHGAPVMQNTAAKVRALAAKIGVEVLERQPA